MAVKLNKTPLKNDVDLDSRDWPDFLCGAGAAFTNILITFPAYKIMFRQQLEGIVLKKAAKQIIREGISNLYRGIIPPLIQRGTSLSLMFGSYHKFQRILSQTFTDVNPTVVNAFAALLAGSVEATLTPFERVQILLSHRAYNERFSNTYHVFKEIRINYGFREYYRGLTAILLRNGPSNVLFFGLRGKIKEMLPESSTKMGNMANDFVSGAVLGAALSTLFFPVNVVKNQMQKNLGGEFTSVIKTFILVYNERGRSIKRLYYGLPLNYTRALVSWGIINCTYEELKKLIGKLNL